jgi:hypothetical protein
MTDAIGLLALLWWPLPQPESPIAKPTPISQLILPMNAHYLIAGRPDATDAPQACHHLLSRAREVPSV